MIYFTCEHNHYKINGNVVWKSMNTQAEPVSKIMQSVCALLSYYSGTSHNGYSEKRTTSVQRTKFMTRIEFSIALILKEPQRSGQPLYSVQRTITMLPTDKM